MFDVLLQKLQRRSILARIRNEASGPKVEVSYQNGHLYRVIEKRQDRISNPELLETVKGILEDDFLR